MSRAWILVAVALLASVVHARPQEEEPGTWNLVGKDLYGWSAKVVFLEESNSGYFDWKSEKGDSGREIFTYSFDEKTRVLSITGEKIIDPRGKIIQAQYRARLSKDGSRLEDGTWFGTNVLPGTWSATRAKKEESLPRRQEQLSSHG